MIVYYLFGGVDVSELVTHACVCVCVFVCPLQQVLISMAPTAAAAAPAVETVEAMAPHQLSAASAAGTSARERWCVSKMSTSTSSASPAKVG